MVVLFHALVHPMVPQVKEMEMEMVGHSFERT